MTEPDPKDVRSGPIRHEALSDELLEQIRSVYEIVGAYLETTLEQFEINFMRDAEPEGEVLIWSAIAAAWMDYHKQHLDDELLPETDEKKLLAALIAISTGVRGCRGSRCAGRCRAQVAGLLRCAGGGT